MILKKEPLAPVVAPGQIFLLEAHHMVCSGLRSNVGPVGCHSFADITVGAPGWLVELPPESSTKT